MSFKNETSLDDLALFLGVAEAGSLTQAAQKAGVPLPTFSRRMRALEAQMERSLFLRGTKGMALTEDGRALATELRGLDDIRNRVTRWQQATERTPIVRITAGDWTAAFLARDLPQTRSWNPAFVATTAALDLARREADIGIRAAPPDHSWLARQRLRPVTYAIYAAHEEVQGYIGATQTSAAPPSLRWLHATYADDITVTVNSPRLALDLAEAGMGRAVLPTFIGDGASSLQRVSDEIDTLAHDQWLVSHNDTRNDPPIRAALADIHRILRP